MKTYFVKLNSFEGPLDLLLHLVNQLEIDIYDIPVAEITNQYIEYIRAMQQIELNVASEYLVMAATLIEMKSKMLLPKRELEMEDEYEEDPREQLIQKLITYRKFKEAAQLLQEKELEENEIYTRTPIKFDHLIEEAQTVKGDVSLFDMLDAVEKMLRRKKWKAPLETTISRMEISIEDRMEEIITVVKRAKQPVTFDSLFPYPSKPYIVTTLLAILQLMKAHRIYCKQTDHFGTIYVSEKRDDLEDSRL